MKSVGQSVLFLTIFDDYQRMFFVCFPTRKSKVFSLERQFVKFAQGQTGKNAKHLRSDSGGEYLSDELDFYLKQQGIVSEDTEPYTLQRNGVAERSNSALTNKARSIMKNMTVPNKFCAEALATAVHIRKVIP